MGHWQLSGSAVSTVSKIVVTCSDGDAAAAAAVKSNRIEYLHIRKQRQQSSYYRRYCHRRTMMLDFSFCSAMCRPFKQLEQATATSSVRVVRFISAFSTTPCCVLMVRASYSIRDFSCFVEARRLHQTRCSLIQSAGPPMAVTRLLEPISVTRKRPAAGSQHQRQTCTDVLYDVQHILYTASLYCTIFHFDLFL